MTLFIIIVFSLLLLLLMIFNLIYIITLINKVDENIEMRKKYEKYISNLPPVEAFGDIDVLFKNPGRGFRLRTKKGILYFNITDDERTVIELKDKNTVQIIWTDEININI